MGKCPVFPTRHSGKVVGIPNSIDNSVLEETVRGVLKKLVSKLTNGMFKPVIA